MRRKVWRLKTPPQPLVFRFEKASDLCGAVARLYRVVPGMAAGLSGYGGRYYLAVYAGLRERRRVLLAARGLGVCLGAAPVLYSYYAEHGGEVSRSAIAELGAVLARLHFL